MSEPSKVIKQTHGLEVKQERSKLTYSALINTGFKMLQSHDLQDISIAELATKAGYSVGAFYARFRSKDEFFDAMITEHLSSRTAILRELFTAVSAPKIPSVLISNIVNYYWEHRMFWRAVIARSVREPDSWEIMRKHRRVSIKRFMDTLSNKLSRTLTKKEKADISFAFQTTLGTVDIAILNQPGPIQIQQKQFVTELTRSFKLVADYDAIISRTKTGKASKKSKASRK